MTQIHIIQAALILTGILAIIRGHIHTYKHKFDQAQPHFIIGISLYALGYILGLFFP